MVETEQNINHDACKKMGALALKDLHELIDETRLTKWFFAYFHHGHARCFYCGEDLSERSTRSFLDGRRASCGSCRKNNQFFKGTPLHGTRAAPAQVLILAILFDLGLSRKKIAELVDVPVGVVRVWQKKLNPSIQGVLNE